MMSAIDRFLSTRAPVLPVITIDDAGAVDGLAGALSAGGVESMEITLRSKAALDAIRLAKSRHPRMTIAAGTVYTPAQVESVAELGVDFAVSPGISRTLLEACRDAGVEIFPGIAHPSDILLGVEYGLTRFKLFPAALLGGIEMLNALAGPFPDLQFCPTGGLNADNFCDFLELPNVCCVGGSWMAPGDRIQSQDWAYIEQQCRETVNRI